MLKSFTFLLKSKHLVLLKPLRNSSCLSSLLNLKLESTQCLLNATANSAQKKYFHSSPQTYFIKSNNETPSGPDKSKDSRIVTSSPTSMPKSALSDDLKSFLNSVTVDESEKEQQTVVQDKKPDDNKKKGLFATMFSRENSWKITLVFFSSWFGFLVIYVLTNWGNINCFPKFIC